jgi:hypothetical protein
MEKSLKEKIIELRKNGKTYNEIKDEMGCSKSLISYYCNKYNLGRPVKKINLTTSDIFNINEFYKTHTVVETCEKFNISNRILHKYADNKMLILTEDERKKRNYGRVKLHRQKIKEMAVIYKGGKCEICGYDKCNWAFDFHHIDKTKKEYSISSNSTLSWDKVKIEVDKCIMLCANCHRELHYNEHIKKFNKDVL